MASPHTEFCVICGKAFGCTLAAKAHTYGPDECCQTCRNRVYGPANTARVCGICGCDPSEHNWEAHAAEMRAGY